MKPLGSSILNLGRFVALPLVGLVLAAPASAQNDPLLEEITVVAQKREQNIMDVPVAITAVTGAQIEASGIKDMNDLQQNVPGLIVSGSQTTTTANFSIRGIGSTSNNFGVESSVGLYVDGVYRSRQSSMINELVDVEAVEVLRGPQGTLFGKNTAAGAINVRTVAPTLDERNAFVEFQVGDLDLRRLTAARNFTLTDEITVRATYFQSERDGYVDNYTYNLLSPTPSIGIQENAFNNRDRWGLRVQAVYDNGTNFTARIIGDYSEIDEICCVGTSRIDALFSKAGLAAGQVIPGTDAVRLQLGNIVFTDFDYSQYNLPLPPTVISGVSWDDYITSANYLPISQNQDRGTSVELNWDLESGATLTSVTAVRMFDTYDFIDPDFNDTDLAVRYNDAEQDSISQELRLAGTFGESSNWLVGAYYFAQDIDSITETTGGPDLQAYFDLLTAAAGGTAPSEITAGVTQISDTLALFGREFPAGAAALPDGMFANNVVKQKHDGYAVFGQVDWALSDALTLTLGARYTDESKDIDAVYTQTNPGTAVPNSAAIEGAFDAFGAWVLAGTPGDEATLDQLEADLEPLRAVAGENAGWAAYEIQELSPRPNVNRTLDDDQVTGTAKITWYANDATMLYLSYGTGFKAGGTNADRIRFNPPPAPDFQLFDAEKSTSIEAGFKGDIGDHVRISAAIYQTDFEDFQSNTFEGSGFILRNAGDIEIKGAELEFIWHPLDNTTISGYFAYNKGEYKSFERAVCWAAAPFQLLEEDPGDNGTGFCDHSGLAIPYNPEERAQFTFNQDFPMGNNNLFFRAEYAFTGETTTDGDADPLTLQDDYGILNLRVGVDIADWNSTITLWGRNVTDERYYTQSFDPPLQNFGLMNSYPTEIATWGVTFRKNWD